MQQLENPGFDLHRKGRYLIFLQSFLHFFPALSSLIEVDLVHHLIFLVLDDAAQVDVGLDVGEGGAQLEQHLACRDHITVRKYKF